MSQPQPYVSTVAVPFPDEHVLRRVIGERFAPESTLNVEKMLAGTDGMYPALIGMVQAIFNTSDIDAVHRETIILRAAAVLDCPYEWQANVQMAANAGITNNEISAISANGTVVGIDEELALLCRAVDEMYGAEHTLTDDTLSALLTTFGASITRQYIATISWFSLLSLFLNATRTPLETFDKIGSRTTPVS